MNKILCYPTKYLQHCNKQQKEELGRKPWKDQDIKLAHSLLRKHQQIHNVSPFHIKQKTMKLKRKRERLLVEGKTKTTE